jgi:hypothetical protein
VNRDETLESIIQLASAEEQAPAALRGELRVVRERLEDSLGQTVRPAEAARLLSVSRPALKKWIDQGEVATVLTREGRREIPVPELVDLAVEVEHARAHGRERPLSAVVRERRRAAEEAVDIERLLPRRKGRTHREPELQSLAYHRLVAERLTPRLVEDARARLRRWERSDRIQPHWADEWRRVLEKPLPDIARTIASDSVRARELRQTSPFAGALTEQERRRLLAAVEARG